MDYVPMPDAFRVFVWLVLFPLSLRSQSPFGSGSAPPATDTSKESEIAPERSKIVLDTSPTKWRYEDVADDMTNEKYQMLTVETDSEYPDDAGHATHPTLSIVCGKSIDLRKQIMFNARRGMDFTIRRDPIEMRVAGLLVRTDADDKASERVAWVGERDASIGSIHKRIPLIGTVSTSFDAELFHRIFVSNTLRIRYEPLLSHGTETVTFDVHGLRQVIDKMHDCDLPIPRNQT